MNPETSKMKRPSDLLSRIAFYLTLLIFVWPIHADLMVALLSSKKYGYAVLFSLGCVTLVLIPAIISLRRLLANPVLRGRGYIYATFAILAVMELWTLTAVISMANTERNKHAETGAAANAPRR